MKGYIQPAAKLIENGQKLALGYKWTEEQKKKNLNLFEEGYTPWNKGNKVSDKQKDKLRKAWILRKTKGLGIPWNKGKKRPEMSGEKHFAWKGGKYDRDRKIDMGRAKYRKWRKAVLERDGNVCVLCGSDIDLNVDHIRPYANYPKLRYNLNNGRVLCVVCHKLTGTYGKKEAKWQGA